MMASFKPTMLIAVVVMLFAFHVTPATAQIPLWKGDAKTIKVCTSEYTPMVYCVDREPADYTGYEIELFRKVMTKLNWTDDMLEWSCMDWDAMEKSLADNDGQCDMAVAGLAVSSSLVQDGLIFTWPTYRNGLKVLAYPTEETALGRFSFFDAFEWQVWVATLVTMLVVPFIIYGIDRLVYPTIPPHLEGDIVFERYFWESMGRPMWMRSQIAVSWPGNIVILGFSFQIMIIFALYIGYAAGNLTTTLLDGQISDVSSLPGKAVGTWEPYVAQLQRYGVAAVGYPWDTVEDEQAMLAALSDGSVAALVLDGSFLDYTANQDCSVSVVGGTFDRWEQATAFPNGFDNTELVSAYNQALVELEADGEVSGIKAEQLLPSDSCIAAEDSSITYAVNFEQVAGLWIMLAGSVAAALLLMGMHLVHRRFLAKKLENNSAYQTVSDKMAWLSNKSASNPGAVSNQGVDCDVTA